MQKEDLAIIENVEYDVDTTQILKQPDIRLLEKFLDDGTHENMCITYETHNECEKRRMCIRAYLAKSEHKGKYYTSVRGCKLYILKEQN